MNNHNFQFVEISQLREIVDNSIISAIELYLKSQKTEYDPPPIPSSTLYTRKEAAKRLNISPSTLSVYQRNGLIKFYRIGRKVLFTEANIQDSLKQINIKQQKNY